MAPFYACDHCGRTGVTFGIVYPNGDMSQPALHLCQHYNGTPIEPNCYHLVVERGEPLGQRKKVAISAADRQSARNEAARLRFTENVATGTVVVDTARPGEDFPDTPPRYEHPLTGEVIDTGPREATLDPAITAAESSKGIINPHSADQRPLVNPDSEEGQAYLDRQLAAEQAKVNVLPPSQQRPSVVDSPYVNPGPTASMPPADPPEVPIVGQPAPLPEGTQAGQDAAGQPLTPAQVAAAAQAKADSTLRKNRPVKKAPAKKAAAKKAQKPSPQVSVDTPPPQTPKPANTEDVGDPDNPKGALPDEPVAGDPAGRTASEKQADEDAAANNA